MRPKIYISRPNLYNVLMSENLHAVPWRCALAVGGGGGLPTPHVTSGSLPARRACFAPRGVAGGIERVKRSGKETRGRMWGTWMELCDAENDMDNGTVM